MLWPSTIWSWDRLQPPFILKEIKRSRKAALVGTLHVICITQHPNAAFIIGDLNHCNLLTNVGSFTTRHFLLWNIFTANQTINACREWGEQPTGLSAVMDISYRVHRWACSIIKDSCYPQKSRILWLEERFYPQTNSYQINQQIFGLLIGLLKKWNILFKFTVCW